MRRSIIMVTAAVAAFVSTPSLAAVTLATTPGSSVYAGPTPTYTFDGPTPGLTTLNGTVCGNNGNASRPAGSTGCFLVTGPTYGSAVLSSPGFAYSKTISFIWGSVDTGNLIEFLDGSSNVLASFTGSQVLALTSGYAAGFAHDDPLVYFTFTGDESANLRAIRFSSATDSFELDNISVAVPEPATWGMMLLGFAAIGVGMRRRKASKTATSFA